MLDLSNSPLKLGLTIDLNNYGINPEIGEYIRWFSDDTNGEAPKILHVYTPNKHIHKKPGIFTYDDKKIFEDKIGEFARFIKEKSSQVELVSFQFPHNQLPPDLSILIELDELYGSLDKNIQRKKLIQYGRITDLKSAHEMVLSYFDIISNLDFSSLKYPPIIVLHSGGILPGDLIDDDLNKTINKFKNIRRRLLINQINYHNSLLEFVKGRNVLMSLENVPIWDAAFASNFYSQTERKADYDQWLSEHAFEDLEKRFSIGGVYTLDIAHACMNINYFSQDILKAASLELIKNEFFGIPNSLISIEDHIKVASLFFSKRQNNQPNIIYHLNDCNGLFSDNEGVPIGSSGSLINWKNVIRTMRDYTPNVYGALEIQESHVRKKYDSNIRKSLENFLSYCETN